MIEFSVTGDYNNTEKWLRDLTAAKIKDRLSYYGSMGVKALSSSTPIDSGLTAGSWSYRIESRGSGSWSIVWTNSNVVSGRNVAILIQSGHGTRGGGYVQGRDYINPAMRPVFDQISKDLDKVVKSV